MHFHLKIGLITFLSIGTSCLNTVAQTISDTKKHGSLRAELGLNSSLLSFSGDLGISNFSGSNFSIGLEPVLHYSNWIFSLPLERGAVRWNSRQLVNPANFETQYTSIAAQGKYRILKEKSGISPFIGFGIGNMFFSSSSDLKDASGINYNYWTDGSIRDIVETPENIFSSNLLQRDYIYETYTQRNQRLIYYPVSVGITGSLTERLRLELSYQVNLLQGDLFDSNIDKSGWDRLSAIKVGVYVDLSKGNSKHQKKPIQGAKTSISSVNYNDVDFENLFNSDEDLDGISDLYDRCYGTPQGATIDEFGCPKDTDGDGIIDFLDAQIDSPADTRVNSQGVAWTDQEYIAHQNDSLAYFKNSLRRISRNSRPYPVRKFIPETNYKKWNQLLELHPEWRRKEQLSSSPFPQELKVIDKNGDSFISNTELEDAVNSLFDIKDERLNLEILRKAIDYAFRNQ
jgi:hypothetical protein